jgi:leucyl-tRNA synthetase
MEKYDHRKIESKWQKIWEGNPSLFSAKNDIQAPKKYILDMFPYPSGDGLHVGHVESYTATDIISRYSRMKGLNVLHPQGFDAFGLPAENYAIKTKIHPMETTKKAIATFKGQMKRMGFSYDWSREICSADPGYYRWTQWFFLLLYKNSLAYKKLAKANWCPSCQTVLANEQVVNGKCERCGTEVVQKDLEQWFFRITDFIEKNGKTTGLLDGLQKIDWPESTKAGQKNWIGRSEGAQFKMQIENSDKFIEVYTTRLDTVFGMTYAIIAPEHRIIEEIKEQIKNWDKVEKYISAAKRKTELQRISETKEKTGVEVQGVKVINPFTKKAIPLFVSDYVLSHYGTGAIMAVPAHDERDFEFAKKHSLPITEVIKSLNGSSSIEKSSFNEDGILINSGEYDSLTSEEAREKLAVWISKNKLGEKKINYKMRDWLVSRQRYWGAPIPIIYCPDCGDVPVPENDLPVLLPTDVDFMPTGESPLVKSKSFHAVKCPKCGKDARRESDTMDTFVCSSWYYFRYSDPQNEKEFASKKQIKGWLPVDLYVGGAEHTVLHLLYARFFTKVLHKLGYVDFDEPFLKLRHQGIILAEDGNKMSKSLGNVINPDKVVEEYGADALRCFEMFMGPLEDMKPWNTRGIVGISRFLERVYKYIEWGEGDFDKEAFSKWKSGEFAKESGIAYKNKINKTIKKVTEDIENFKFNTAISSLMTFLNFIYKENEGEINSSVSEIISVKDFKNFLIILSPFAPHIAEELWQKLGHNESIFKEKWPEFDENFIKEDSVEMVVQINGKVRGKFSVAVEISEEEVKNLALMDENIQKWLKNKEPKKMIFVKGKLLNIVI